jgi:hypothetical protein
MDRDTMVTKILDITVRDILRALPSIIFCAVVVVILYLAIFDPAGYPAGTPPP